MFTKQLSWIINISIISILIPAQISAAPPRKPNIGMYKGIIDRSPFTIKPEKVVAVQESPLERDWTLASISPSSHGYSVTLMNKKDRTDRIRFLPGFSSGEYKLLEVKQDFESRSNSKVYVQKGSQKAWIGYDDALLALKSSPKTGSRTTTKTSSSSRLTLPKTSNSSMPPGITNSSSENSDTTKVVPTRRVRRVPIKK